LVIAFGAVGAPETPCSTPSTARATPSDVFSGALEDEGFEVARGVFGDRMSVELANDGPVTILLET
jgi:D-Tyr-tRNAtyr deacylase